jgi:tetratricopeptide (TPR) repeat protein
MRHLILSILIILIITAGSAYGQDDKPLELAKAKAEIRQGNYAIVIGINNYDSEDILDLTYSEADALAICDTLINRCGYDPSHVYLYLDGKNDGSITTGVSTANIFTADRKSLLHRFYSISDPDLYGEPETLLVYFSGHGACINGVNYVLPVDGEAEAALAQDCNLNVDDVLNWLKGSKFKRQVVYVDACRSRLTIRRGDYQPYIERAFKYSTGLHVMMGTKLGEYSREEAVFGHGVFTKFLLDGLKGAAADENGLVTVGFVADFVFDQMTKYSDADPSKKQVPIMSGEGNYMIPLAVLDGGDNIVEPYSPGVPLTNVDYELKQVWDKLDKAYNSYLHGNRDEEARLCEEALVALDRIISSQPNNSMAYAYRARALFSKNENDPVIAACEKALAINPDNHIAYHYRGNAYFEKYDYDKAIADFNKAIEIDPNYAMAYNSRGCYYKDKKRKYDQAIAEFSKAIDIDPNYALAYCNRGLTYWDKKDYLSAYDDFCKAVEIDPNYTYARNKRQEVYNIMNK